LSNEPQLHGAKVQEGPLQRNDNLALRWPWSMPLRYVDAHGHMQGHMAFGCGQPLPVLLSPQSLVFVSRRQEKQALVCRACQARYSCVTCVYVRLYALARTQNAESGGNVSWPCVPGKPRRRCTACRVLPRYWSRLTRSDYPIPATGPVTRCDLHLSRGRTFNLREHKNGRTLGRI